MNYLSYAIVDGIKRSRDKNDARHTQLIYTKLHLIIEGETKIEREIEIIPKLHFIKNHARKSSKRSSIESF